MMWECRWVFPSLGVIFAMIGAANAFCSNPVLRSYTRYSGDGARKPETPKPFNFNEEINPES